MVTAPLTGTPEVIVTTLLSNQGIIWGFDILPNGNLLFTQKAGTMRLFDTTNKSNTLISGLPSNISATGQGGLLDVAIPPDHATSRSVFVTYSIAGGFLSLAKFILNGTEYTRIPDKRVSCCKIINAANASNPSDKIPVKPITTVQIND